MPCPHCGGETERGAVKTWGSVPFGYYVSWVSEAEREKFFKHETVLLKNTAEGHYCKHCDKFFAEYERKQPLL